MAKKNKNSNPDRKSQPSNKNVNTILQGFKSIGYGILGAAVFFLFNHILLFSPPLSSAYTITFTVLCGVLAFVCSTKLFLPFIDKITPICLGLVFLQVLVTVALSYNWIETNVAWNYISGGAAIPLGIVWYFIIRHEVVSEPVDGFVFPVKNQFQDKYFRILAITVFLICGVLIFYRLGFYDIWEDENMVINAAIGIQQHGLDYLQEGYDRVWVHSLLISWFFDLFGVSEFTGRLPSALFGLLFVVVCYYSFTRWYGLGLIAVLLPLVCMMNDRFLILFRYMRMYALLIPLFILGVYILYRTVTIQNKEVFFRGKKIPLLNNRMFYIAGSIFMLLLLAHLHKLAMIVLPVFFIFICILAWKMNTRYLKYFLLGVIGCGIILAYLAFGLELDSLRMFRQVAALTMVKHGFYEEYYRYMLDNGLPINSTMMTLIGGLGLLSANVSKGIKSIVGISYLLIGIALISMIYLIASEGQDYRYIAHIIPFAVAILLFVWYHSGNLIFKGGAKWALVLFLIISLLAFKADYKRVYVKHPWAPSYSIVYKTLKDKYRKGDALFAQNVKTYYLDPEKLAGNLYHHVPGRKEYTLDQFKRDIAFAQRGWVMWDKHKVYQWRDDVIVYIYQHFRPYHGGKFDDYGVELWYFDESMIPKDDK